MKYSKPANFLTKGLIRDKYLEGIDPYIQPPQKL
jgi:hypothetical protein